ncbi:hypothetical protein SB861_03650 [Paraburkholderia sp. SIMBA_049]
MKLTGMAVTLVASALLFNGRVLAQNAPADPSNAQSAQQASNAKQEFRITRVTPVFGMEERKR